MPSALSRAQALRRKIALAIACSLLFALLPSRSLATELKPGTAAAFDRYIQATEARMSENAANGQFLAIDCLSDAARQAAYHQLRSGGVYVQRMHTSEDDRPVRVLGGLIHHWVAVIFIPDTALAKVRAVLEDYDRHGQIYQPNIRESKLLSRDGDRAAIFIQFFSQSIVTIAFNANFEVRDTQFGLARVQSVSRSTRIAEVADFGQPDQHELPVGRDHGYMWRLNTYWRLEQKDGGVYVQNESIELSRAIPGAIAWFVYPLIKNIPRDFLTRLLIATRTAALKPAS